MHAILIRHISTCNEYCKGRRGRWFELPHVHRRRRRRRRFLHHSHRDRRPKLPWTFCVTSCPTERRFSPAGF